MFATFNTLTNTSIHFEWNLQRNPNTEKIQSIQNIWKYQFIPSKNTISIFSIEWSDFRDLWANHLLIKRWKKCHKIMHRFVVNVTIANQNYMLCVNVRNIISVCNGSVVSKRCNTMFNATNEVHCIRFLSLLFWIFSFLLSYCVWMWMPIEKKLVQLKMVWFVWWYDTSGRMYIFPSIEFRTSILNLNNTRNWSSSQFSSAFISIFKILTNISPVVLVDRIFAPQSNTAAMMAAAAATAAAAPQFVRNYFHCSLLSID